MDISLENLEEALSIRRQIGTLEKRLSSILGAASLSSLIHKGPRKMSAQARAKIAAAMRARWAKRKGRMAIAKREGGISAAGRKRLSQLMKARWAVRKRAVGKAVRKKGGITPAGRKRLSQLMKARWAARKRADGQK